ncbi:response regulator [Marinobacterium sp. AK62]|uniref:Response regulator n=1 Tax=Marinobacterium alkalitolerans TaxID=1542925 RepID=A0ABS3Z8G3_9GAMM|nr:response regulator [Marinobacterium alkalitolerans]MBP0048010.1 response regulator [Marinobacterium alkalitolerans]
MPEVLVVDDEPNILLSLEFLMQQAGYRVVTAADAEQASRLIEANRPDLVLLDISLPGMSGFDLLEQLRQSDATRDLPVIMLTAHGREVEKEKGLALGANDYITKPFSTRDLVSRVGTLLADHSSEG